jgi:hypothetical protein
LQVVLISYDRESEPVDLPFKYGNYPGSGLDDNYYLLAKLSDTTIGQILIRPAFELLQQSCRFPPGSVPTPISNSKFATTSKISMEIMELNNDNTPSTSI